MAASSSMSAQLELEAIFQRLNYLEKREESTSDEMLTLRQENLDLTRANKVLAKKVNELSKTVNAMSGARTNKDLAKRLDKVEAKTKTFKKCKQDIAGLKSLQVILNRCVVRHGGGGLEKRVQVIEPRIDVLECKICPGLSDQVQSLGTEVKALKQNNDFKDSTVFFASVKPTQPLVKGTGVKLDKCDGVDTPGSYFDKGCCEYQSPLTGIYDVRVTMAQTGNGRLRVNVKVEGLGTILAGKTEQHGNRCYCSSVVTLKKGQKVWVEVVRLDGQAEMNFCLLSGFLVCPL